MHADERQLRLWAGRIMAAFPPGSPFHREIMEVELQYQQVTQFSMTHQSYNHKPLKAFDEIDMMKSHIATVNHVIEMFSTYPELYDDELHMRRMVKIRIGEGYKQPGFVYGYSHDYKGMLQAANSKLFYRDYMIPIITKTIEEKWGGNPDDE